MSNTISSQLAPDSDNHKVFYNTGGFSIKQSLMRNAKPLSGKQKPQRSVFPF